VINRAKRMTEHPTYQLDLVEDAVKRMAEAFARLNHAVETLPESFDDLLPPPHADMQDVRDPYADEELLQELADACDLAKKYEHEANILRRELNNLRVDFSALKSVSETVSHRLGGLAEKMQIPEESDPAAMTTQLTQISADSSQQARAHAPDGGAPQIAGQQEEDELDILHRLDEETPDVGGVDREL
jgi:surfactin synthase thioesterase subunit